MFVIALIGKTHVTFVLSLSSNCREWKEQKQLKLL